MVPETVAFEIGGSKGFIYKTNICKWYKKEIKAWER